ncbi:MAG: hypothetical protein ACO25F_02745 [Erythrobacter sp.]
MIALVLPVAFQAAAAEPFAQVPQPSLDQYGWELVFEQGGEFPAVQYIEPSSIRPVAGSDTRFTVTTSAQWTDDSGQWKVSPTGIIVNCRTRSWTGDWISSEVAGEHVITYVKDERSYAPAKGSPLDAVIDKVCGSEIKAR